MTTVSGAFLRMPASMVPREEVPLRRALPAAFAALSVAFSPMLAADAEARHQRQHEIDALLGRIDCGGAGHDHHHSGANAAPTSPAPSAPSPCCGGKPGSAVLRRKPALQPGDAIPT